MNKKLLILGIIPFLLIPVYAQESNEYKMKSDTIFLKFNLNDNILTSFAILDNGWLYFDRESQNVLHVKEDFSKVWIIGEFQNGDEFYLTWIIEDSKVKLGLWIYSDGEYEKTIYDLELINQKH